MNIRLPFLVSIIFVTLACTAAPAQSITGNGTAIQPDSRDPRAAAIESLRRLEADVIVYRSLADFEAGGRLARVPLPTFESHLREVDAELAPLLDRLPAGKSKLDLMNALDSFRDGVFWWRQIDQRRVVNVSALAYADSNRTEADTVFVSSIPYTVAIHWRQAEKYLRRAEQALKDR